MPTWQSFPQLVPKFHSVNSILSSFNAIEDLKLSYSKLFASCGQAASVSCQGTSHWSLVAHKSHLRPYTVFFFRPFGALSLLSYGFSLIFLLNLLIYTVIIVKFEGLHLIL